MIVRLRRSTSATRMPSTPWRPCSLDQSPIRCPVRRSSVTIARSRAEFGIVARRSATAGSRSRGRTRGSLLRSSRPFLRGSSRAIIECVTCSSSTGTGFARPCHEPCPVQVSRSIRKVKNAARAARRWLIVRADCGVSPRSRPCAKSPTYAAIVVRSTVSTSPGASHRRKCSTPSR